MIECIAGECDYKHCNQHGTQHQERQIKPLQSYFKVVWLETGKKDRYLTTVFIAIEENASNQQSHCVC